MKTSRADSKRSKKRRREARKWLAHRDSKGKWSPASLRKWQKWAADPENYAAYHELERLEELLRTLPPPVWVADEELRADPAQVEWDDSSESITADMLFHLQNILRAAGPYQRYTAIAAPLLTLVLVIWRSLIPSTTQTAHVLAVEYETGPGEHRDIVLADHSVIRLAGSTRVTVLFSQETRHVFLSRGEALFEVKHDPRRPFQVDVGNTHITDAGTTFDVRCYADKQVTVAVTEGAVTVTPRDRDASDNRSLGAPSDSGTRSLPVKVATGEEISSNEKGQLSPPHAADIPTVTSWLSGYRIYRKVPLAKVVEDMQLYTLKRIELDPALAAFLFTGYADQTQPEQWVHGLMYILPVHIESHPGWLIIRCQRRGCPGVDRP